VTGPLLALLALLAVTTAHADDAPTFVGGARCASCHPRAAEAYRDSDHAHAIAVADEATVRGAFDGARLTRRGVTTTFLRRDGRFLVRTPGPDGRLADFPVVYTFGIRPLQQYLLPLAGGRFQAFDLAWDTRPRGAGGQRWFALPSGPPAAPGEPFHWTGREQTWNFQCAECHATDLRKGYDVTTDRYTTTWAELTVSCEACHGPGSGHVTWVERAAGGGQAADDPTRGLVVRLGHAHGPAEVEACARCHARRRPIADPYVYGRPLLDTHVPRLLEAGLYEADGQIRGEVYEYGSFVQTRMYRAGVTCSDCHEPHRGSLRAPGNAVCARCHRPAAFDTPRHHHHRPATAAARCVGCHMPARVYMGVDPRRDHSFPVPRPDLSVTLGTPNACTGCHRDRPASWAARASARWWPGGPARRPLFAPTLDAGRRGRPGAETLLSRLATDAGQPAIARATALGLLSPYLTPAGWPALRAGLADADPLVRMAALEAAAALPAPRRADAATPGLRDPVRAVRLAAARTLAGVSREPLTPEAEADLDRALDELVAAELANADRPEAHVNLASLYTRLARPQAAEAALATALRLDPRFVPALVSLAELYRLTGRDGEGEAVLARARQLAPDDADVLDAVGRLRMRQGRPAEGLALLRRAATAHPEVPGFAYVYALALHAAGRRDDAVRVLEGAHARRPADRELLAALAAIERERSRPAAALRYAERLARLTPDDPEVAGLVEALRRAVSRRGP
jgi:predicted CXXCH cytochrome family protein